MPASNRNSPTRCLDPDRRLAAALVYRLSEHVHYLAEILRAAANRPPDKA